MKTRKLGPLTVSAIGMGCMGFTHAYGNPPPEEEGIRLVHYAFEQGCRFFDTAEMYSYFRNEEFLGKALKDLPRDQVVISDKFWPTALPGQDMPEGKLSEAGLRRALEDSLRRLGTDYIDLYTEHQMDDDTVEDVAYIMGKFIQEGKIRAWGQSSPSADQIRRAHAVTPIAAVQSEYSMMERKWERDVLPLCRSLGIGFVAFAPLGNGFLSGRYRAGQDFAQNDLRRVITRFAPDNMKANKPLLDVVRRMADEKGATPAQVALAWVLAGGDCIVPIPGMRRKERILENLGAAEVSLTEDEYRTLNEALSRITVHGTRDGKDIKKLGTVPDNVDR